MSNDQHVRWQASIGNDTDRKEANSVTPTVRKMGLNAATWESKSILLVDSNPRTRESRAKVLRTRGVIVHCAAGADAARTRLSSATYNLVLVDLGQELEIAEKLVQEIRTNNPRQRAAFLVGRPLYLAASLKGSGSESKPTRLPAAKAPSPALKLEPVSDFGQRVRDAEAKAGL